MTPSFTSRGEIIVVAEWENYIKLLGDGEYDVATLLRTLADVRYHGPVGLQFYALKGEPRENLEAAMRAWKALTASQTSP